MQGPPAAAPGQSSLALHHRCFADSAGRLACRGQPRACMCACTRACTDPGVGSRTVPGGHPLSSLSTKRRPEAQSGSSTKVRPLLPCCLSGLREAALKQKAGCHHEAHAGHKLAPFSRCWRREACLIFSPFTSADHCSCHSYASNSQEQARFLEFLTEWV